jgi:hypothetical protein
MSLGLPHLRERRERREEEGEKEGGCNSSLIHVAVIKSDREVLACVPNGTLFPI